MALVIPNGYSNWLVTITNSAGGISSRSSIAIGIFDNIPLTQGDVGRVANLMRDGLTPAFDNGWTIGPVHVVEGTAGIPKVWDDTGTEAGTHTAQVYAPPGLAYVISKQTGLSGRAHRGRIYLPGVEEANVDEAGLVVGAQVNNLQGWFDDLFDNLVADAAVESLALFHDESTPGDLDPDVITSFLARNIVGSMRPRQRR